jgi:hypothetical protein
MRFFKVLSGIYTHCLRKKQTWRYPLYICPMQPTTFSESLLSEAFSPELLSKYGLRPDSLSETQFEAIRGVAANFKANKQGGVIRTLATLISQSPSAQDDILRAAGALAALSSKGLDSSGIIAQSKSAGALEQAAQAYAAKTEKKQAQSAGDEFSVNETPADWEDGRYKVFVAHNENDCIRYGQNKRYGFCISRRENNFYHDYRAKHNASYFFVYDTGVSPYDPTHITVISARADGGYDFTFANNAEDYRTRKFKGNLDAFLATKPGLEKARHLFVPTPLTDQESSDVAQARAASPEVPTEKRVPFASLNPAQQSTYLKLGYSLSNPEYEGASPAIRDLYISRAHMLTDEQAAVSTEAQRRRAATLFWRYNRVDKQHPAAWLSAYPLTDTTQSGTGSTPNGSVWPPAASAVATWFGSAKSPAVNTAAATSLLKEASLPVGPGLINQAQPSAQRAYLLQELQARRPVPETTLSLLTESSRRYYYEQCPKYGQRVPQEVKIARLAALAGVR